MAPKRKRSRQCTNKSDNRLIRPPEDVIDGRRRKEILRVFKVAVESNKGDSFGPGMLHIRKVKRVLKDLGLAGLNSASIRSYFDDASIETLDADMFLRLAADKTNQMEKTRIAFDLIDEGGKGLVVFEDLQRICVELGEEITETELLEMIDFADSSRQGLLQLKDMLRIAHEVNL